MRKMPALLLLLLPAAAAAGQAIQPGRWDVTSTIVDLAVPGVPGFLLRMAKGKSKTEHKCLPPGQEIAALLAPDPKAGCHVDSLRIADGRYAQQLSCPQKKGGPVRIIRTGSYDGNGFAGRVQMSGQTPKGAMNVTLDQHAAHAAGACRT